MLLFKLRTLLIVMAIAPAVLAGAWFGYRSLRPRPPMEVEFEVIYLNQTGDRRYILKDGKRVLPPTAIPATLNHP